MIKLSHTHNVYDSDNKFIIDGISRVIKNNSVSKTTVMQFDHNSERFGFELPRYIEGHDMMDCNRVEVHYLNIEASTKQQNEGIYSAFHSRKRELGSPQKPQTCRSAIMTNHFSSLLCCLNIDTEPDATARTN